MDAEPGVLDMKGLRAGGLALVIRSTDSHEVGRVVTLIQMVRPGEEFTAPDGIVCRWRPYNPASWLVSGDVQSNMPNGLVFFGWAVFPPTHLMPIDSTDPDKVDERQKEKPVEVG